MRARPEEHMFNLKAAFPEAAMERDADRLEKAKLPFDKPREKEKVVFGPPSDSLLTEETASSSWMSMSLADGDDAPPPEGFFADLEGYSEPESDEEEQVPQSPVPPSASPLSQNLDGFTDYSASRWSFVEDDECYEAPAPAPRAGTGAGARARRAQAPEPAQAPAPAPLQSKRPTSSSKSTTTRRTRALVKAGPEIPGLGLSGSKIWADHEEETKVEPRRGGRRAGRRVGRRAAVDDGRGPEIVQDRRRRPTSPCSTSRRVRPSTSASRSDWTN